MVSKSLVARRPITRFVVAVLSWLAYAKVVKLTVYKLLLIADERYKIILVCEKMLIPSSLGLQQKVMLYTQYDEFFDTMQSIKPTPKRSTCIHCKRLATRAS